MNLCMALSSQEIQEEGTRSSPSRRRKVGELLCSFKSNLRDVIHKTGWPFFHPNVGPRGTNHSTIRLMQALYLHLALHLGKPGRITVGAFCSRFIISQVHVSFWTVFAMNPLPQIVSSFILWIVWPEILVIDVFTANWAINHIFYRTSGEPVPLLSLLSAVITSIYLPSKLLGTFFEGGSEPA